MNNKIIPKSLVLMSMLMAINVAASTHKTIEACEINMATTPELSSCLDTIREQKDRELQTWINNQVFILEELAAVTGRKASLEMFKRSQRNFITYRENNCRWQYLVISPGTGAASAFKKCYITLTKDRIEELTQINK